MGRLGYRSVRQKIAQQLNTPIDRTITIIAAATNTGATSIITAAVTVSTVMVVIGALKIMAHAPTMDRLTADLLGITRTIKRILTI